METCTPNQFFHQFLQISEKLTLAELKMLYLVITQPEVIDLSQQEFADKIQTHRRTINLGLKKLRECGYVADIEKNSIKLTDISTDNIPKRDISEAKKFIVNEVLAFYKFRNMQQIVNEDLYNSIIGSLHIHKKLRFNKEFITETIKKSFPEYRFHFSLDISDYASEMEFNVVYYLNQTIISERNAKRYTLDKTEFMEYLYGHFDVSEVDAIKIINSNFPRIFIRDNRIFISKRLINPYRKAKALNIDEVNNN